VEVSPHPVLTAAIEESVEPVGGTVVVGSLRRDDGDLDRFLLSAGELHVRGIDIDWSTCFTDTGARRIDLPTYPFQHQRYWVDEAEATPQVGTLDARFWEMVERGDAGELADALEASDERQRVSLESVLPLLSSWHREAHKLSTVDSWRYRTVWRPAEAAGSAAGTWMVVLPAGPGREHGERVANGLAERGARVLRVVADGTPLANRVAAALDGSAEVAGVLSALGLDERSSPGSAAVPVGFAATVSLLVVLDEAGITAPLWCLTQGAVSVGSSDPVTSPLQALAWGLGPVVAAEWPSRWGGLVDLPETLDERAVERVVRALAATEEDELAVRSSGVFARRLVRAPAPAGAREFVPGGTVLITGGTGALGGHVARWLADRGAEHLVLLSRRGGDASGAAGLEAELTSLGTRVTFAACDVADRDALAEVVAADPPAAVVHAAGTLDDGMLGSLTLEQMDRVLRVKVTGALNLHEVTRDLELSAFVLFSSVAVLLGLAGQGNYAPGNAFLDALASWRRAQGHTATSIAWSHWSGDGIGGAAVAERLIQRGVDFLDPELALTALGQALAHDETFLAVCDLHWEEVAGQFRSSGLLAELIPAPPAADPDEPDLAGQLAGLAEPEREEKLLDLVRAHAASVLRQRTPEAIEPERGFLELGFESITAVELRNRLARATGIALPPTVVFDHPNATALSRYLRSRLLPPDAAEPVSVTAELDRVEAALAATGAAGVPDAAEITARLQRLLTGWRDRVSAGDSTDLDAASDAELADFIGKEFGIS
ncbi:MAG TPA: SDR family NAD(P)-dependent oxidoreductase, partial [Amycolatopsis sp.]|uniref:SDR family NAD(P)-dependent oxidoreductase n=1 Tax=Amycolatopsis sp. TaxID=37632 RepID=UPI002B48C4BF